MVDWKYGLWGGKLDAPNFCERNAHLWFDAFGDLAGVVISENGDSTIAILTGRPETDDQHRSSVSGF